jgi:hypothetical protein
LVVISTNQSVKPFRLFRYFAPYSTWTAVSFTK